MTVLELLLEKRTPVAKRYGKRFLLATAIAALALGVSDIPSAQAASWANTGALNPARHSHTATLLPNGKVLVAGGVASITGITNSAELYDPATGTNQPTGSLNILRRNHTATLLLNGKVLVAGGFDGSQALVSAELYDPTTGSWVPTGDMNGPREFHTATLLQSGMVLVAGGRNLNGATNGAELYNPLTGTWLPTGSLHTNRNLHTATLLSDGQVLVAGGGGFGASAIRGGELYNPSTGIWTTLDPMKVARFAHTATLLTDGTVLVAGGADNSPLDSAELFDPVSKSWQLVGSLHVPRDLHTATLLPNGNVMVTGGFFNGTGTSSVEVYDPMAGGWAVTNSLNTNCWDHTATLLANGSVLVLGGRTLAGSPQSATETFDLSAGSWTPTSPAILPRFGGKSTLLGNGKVILVAGQTTNEFLSSVTTTNTEMFDPSLGTWLSAAPVNFGRSEPTVTLLADGSVLLAGGFGSTNFIRVSERYNPATGVWRTNGLLNVPRAEHTATLLLNGEVLIAGGDSGTSPVGTQSAELYDPVSGTFTATGSMNIGRYRHRAVLLQSGKVLVVGGGGGTNSDFITGSAELFDPSTGRWTSTASLPLALIDHTATLLPNGEVLVAGGSGPDGITNSAFVFNPEAGTNGSWTTVDSLNIGRAEHSAILLPNGKVMVVGGDDQAFNFLTNSETFDPATSKWTPTGPLNVGLTESTLTLLPNGQVLAAAGFITRDAELYDVGLGFTNSSQPQMTTSNSPLNLGNPLTITGSKFRGASENSGGNGQQSSSSDCPVVQLRNIESGLVQLLSTTGWQTDFYISVPVTNFPPGYALATVFVNGIPSASGILLITPMTTAVVLTNPTLLGNGKFQFTFTAAPGAAFTVLAATNVSLPLNNWSALGGATEVSPGHFQFIDPQANQNRQRFYRIHSP